MNSIEDLQAQHSALNHECGVVPLSRTRIEVRGADRASFLHNFCTNDIKKLAPGTGCEAFVTNVQGKTIGHAFFLAGDDLITIDSVAGQGDLLYGHLDKYLITEDVDLRDRSADQHSLLVSGAKISEVSDKLNLPLPTETCGHSIGEIADTKVSILRANITHDPSYLLTSAATDTTQVLDALRAAGAIQCSAGAFALARVEYGFPVFGLDITDANLPQEVDRNEMAISFTKGCYLGQETVARLDALGHVNRLLRRVSVDVGSGSPAPNPGDKIEVGEKEIGWFGTVAPTPKPGFYRALAYLRVEYTETGTQLETQFGVVKVH